MTTQFVKHFRNEKNAGSLKNTLTVINKMVNASKGVLEGKVKFVGMPKITVVAMEHVHTQNDVILHFGVSRCTAKDTYDKTKGIEIATWRSSTDAQLKIAVPRGISHSDLVALFNANADILNNMYVQQHNTHLLGKYEPKKKQPIADYEAQ